MKEFMGNNVIDENFVLTRPLVLLMAAACGMIVGNLYYAQPLLAEIARTFHVSQGYIGTVPMLTQIGYALGMFFILPLGDIKERRSLIILVLCTSALALGLMAASFNLGILIFSAFVVGFSSAAPHLIISLAAQLAPSNERGKIIGTIMSGLLIGILLSRTFSGIIGSAFSWRVVYAIAVGMMLFLAIVLRIRLPKSLPTSKLEYGKLLLSLWHLLKTEPVLRQASLIGAMMFGAFSVFWTSLIFLLESPAYKLGAETAGLFGLIGVVGALAAPLVGRYADRKGPRFTLSIAILSSAISYICFLFLGFKIWGLIIGVIALDLGTQSGQVSNQTRIYALNGEARNRINTVFMVSYFIGGSLGSFLSAYSWEHFGWSGVCTVGFAFVAVAMVVHFIKRI
jgi:predicted MFS family arabinose efflux permease